MSSPQPHENDTINCEGKEVLAIDAELVKQLPYRQRLAVLAVRHRWLKKQRTQERRESKVQAQREYVVQCRHNKVCVWCHGPNTSGHQMCDACKKKDGELDKLRRWERKERKKMRLMFR